MCLGFCVTQWAGLLCTHEYTFLPQTEREQQLAPLVEAARAQMEDAERSTFKQIKELEFKVAEQLDRLRVLYAPPRDSESTRAIAPPPMAVVTLGVGPGTPLSRLDSPGHDPTVVNDEVEKLLALVRVTKNPA
jgi:hypothetical protein